MTYISAKKVAFKDSINRIECQFSQNNKLFTESERFAILSNIWLSVDLCVSTELHTTQKEYIRIHTEKNNPY